MTTLPSCRVQFACPACRHRLHLVSRSTEARARCPRCACVFVAPPTPLHSRPNAEPRELDSGIAHRGHKRQFLLAGMAVALALVGVAIAVGTRTTKRAEPTVTIVPAAPAAAPVHAPRMDSPAQPNRSAVAPPKATPSASTRTPVEVPESAIVEQVPDPVRVDVEPKPQHEMEPDRPTPLAAGNSSPAAFDRVKSAVVLVQGKSGHGSGFLIHPRVVATNSHVIAMESIDQVRIRFSTNGITDEKGSSVRLVYEDKQRDLALLWLDVPASREPLDLATRFDTEKQPEVFVIGNPAQGRSGVALGNSVGTARCSKDSVLIKGQSFYRLEFAAGAGDVRIGPGNSGGPVVDRNGTVVGVLTAGEIGEDGRPRGKAYCIPARAVSDALENLGPIENWDLHARKATGRHALAIAATVLDLDAQLAGALAEARAKLHERVAYNQAELNQLRTIDANLVKAFRKVDSDLQTYAKPFTTLVISCKELPEEEMIPYRLMLERMKRLREIVTQTARITATDTQRALDAREQARKQFDRYLTEAGLDDDFVEKLQMSILRKFDLLKE